MDRLTALVKSFANEEDGAIVSEYGLLIVVLVLGLAIVLYLFREKVNNWFGNIGDNLEDCDATKAKTGC